MKPSGIITLLTDFGNRDGYVAAMKAVILGINPQARLIDLSHEVEPQNVHAGAFLLSTQSGLFPIGTVHVAVIDPGVGTARRLIAVQTAGQFHLAPDNGLLDFCIESGVDQAVEMTNRDLWRHPLSNTFHGRDILAPVAAHLSLGKTLQEIGAPIELEIRRPRSTCTISAEEICGQVVYVDRFGNLVTNISSRDLREFGGGGALEVFLDGRHACRLLTTYASVNAGSPVAVVGGFDRMEISINADSASKRFDAGVGVPVTVRKELQ